MSSTSSSSGSNCPKDETVDEDTCTICLLPLFTLGDSIVALPCGHVLHRDCSSSLVTAMLRPLTADDHLRGIRKQQELGCPLCRSKFAARDILKLHVDLRAFIGAQLIGSASYIEEHLTKQQQQPRSSSSSSSLESETFITDEVSQKQKLNQARTEREYAILKRSYNNLEAEHQSLQAQLTDERILRKEVESSTTLLRQQLRATQDYYEISKKDNQNLQQLLSTTQRELANTMKERDILRERYKVSKEENETIQKEYEITMQQMETKLKRSIEKEKEILNTNLDLQSKCRTLESERNRLDHLCQRQDKQLKQLRNNQNTLPSMSSSSSSSTTAVPTTTVGTGSIVPPPSKPKLIQSTGIHPNSDTKVTVNNIPHANLHGPSLGGLTRSTDNPSDDKPKRTNKTDNVSSSHPGSSVLRSSFASCTTLLSTKGTSINPFFKSNGTIKTTEQQLKDIFQSPIEHTVSPVVPLNETSSTVNGEAYKDHGEDDGSVINLLFDDDDDDNRSTEKDSTQTNQVTHGKSKPSVSSEPLRSVAKVVPVQPPTEDFANGGKRKALHGLTGEINKKAHSMTSSNTVSSLSSSSAILRNGQQMSIMDGVKALQHQASEHKKFWGSL